MFDYIKKAVLIGAGLAVMSAEKAKAAVDELVRKGALTEEEGRETIAALKEKSKEVSKAWEEKLSSSVTAALHRMNIPTRQEIDDLRERLARLEQTRQS